jgi:hypothetical protein
MEAGHMTAHEHHVMFVKLRITKRKMAKAERSRSLDMDMSLDMCSLQGGKDASWVGTKEMNGTKGAHLSSTAFICDILTHVKIKHPFVLVYTYIHIY